MDWQYDSINSSRGVLAPLDRCGKLLMNLPTSPFNRLRALPGLKALSKQLTVGPAGLSRLICYFTTLQSHPINVCLLSVLTLIWSSLGLEVVIDVTVFILAVTCKLLMMYEYADLSF